MYTFSTNRVRDHVRIVEGAEELRLRVDVDPMQIMPQINRAKDLLTTVSNDVSNTEALRTAAEAWAGCMFGKEQTEQLAVFYDHNYLSVLNACTGYFTRRLSRLLLKAQRKRLRR